MTEKGSPPGGKKKRASTKKKPGGIAAIRARKTAEMQKEKAERAAVEAETRFYKFMDDVENKDELNDIRNQIFNASKEFLPSRYIAYQEQKKIAVKKLELSGTQDIPKWQDDGSDATSQKGKGT